MVTEEESARARKEAWAEFEKDLDEYIEAYKAAISQALDRIDSATEHAPGSPGQKEHERRGGDTSLHASDHDR